MGENKNNLILSNNYSLSKIDNAYSEEVPRIDDNIMNNKNFDILEKQIEKEKKFKRREKSELNINIIKNQKNIKLLKKKRKFRIPPTYNEKKEKRKFMKKLKKNKGNKEL